MRYVYIYKWCHRYLNIRLTTMKDVYLKSSSQILSIGIWYCMFWTLGTQEIVNLYILRFASYTKKRGFPASSANSERFRCEWTRNLTNSMSRCGATLRDPQMSNRYCATQIYSTDRIFTYSDTALYE